MFCKNCGAKNPEGALVCAVCAKNISVQQAASVDFDSEKPTVLADANVLPVNFDEEKTVMADAVAPVANPVQHVAPVMPVPPVMQPNPPKKSNRGLVIGLAVVSVVAVAAIVVGVLFAAGVIGGDKSGEEETETAVSVQAEKTTNLPEITGTAANTESPQTEEAAIENVIKENVSAMVKYDGARVKKTLSAFTQAKYVDEISFMGEKAPDLQVQLQAIGTDINDPNAVGVFYAIGVLGSIGGDKNIKNMAVTNVSVDAVDVTSKNLSYLAEEFESSLGISLTNPPVISGRAEATVSLSVEFSDGTAQTKSANAKLLKENGQWKIFFMD